MTFRVFGTPRVRTNDVRRSRMCFRTASGIANHTIVHKCAQMRIKMVSKHASDVVCLTHNDHIIQRIARHIQHHTIAFTVYIHLYHVAWISPYQIYVTITVFNSGQYYRHIKSLQNIYAIIRIRISGFLHRECRTTERCFYVVKCAAYTDKVR